MSKGLFTVLSLPRYSLIGLTVLLGACASSTAITEQPSNTTLPIPQKTHQQGSSAWKVENTALSANQNSFVKQVAQRYQIPENFIQQQLNQAQVNDRVITLVSPKRIASIKRHWQTYRNRFVEPIRIRKGTAFWDTHRQTLAAAEKQYGVPAAIITAIIGVETIYGQNTGSFKLLDALYTLGFYHPDKTRPERSQMFRNQLAALIALAYEGKLDIHTATGSFAGAYGLGQFMPISILHYGVDADKDGKVDLKNSPKDAIFSVANFLVQHGWQANMPVFPPVQLPPSPASLVSGGLEPTFTWQALQQKGASSQSKNASWQKGKQLGVIDLKDEVRGNHEYRVATQNFFTITKYNRSYFYAASVADLATALANQQIRNGYQVTRP
ncbi:lytic murein transglycosylase B [Pelistega sp. NLN82]|uniref:Lytic murein transglycosylase B n=1 Tax=Pelistega ratti TaxID=2652177 RepID=A0A6L9Y8J9_9BURK|nr:lytic murein transglycosylase B [Pelistega ratti]